MQLTDLPSALVNDQTAISNQENQVGKSAPLATNSGVSGQTTIAQEENETVYISSKSVATANETEADNMEQYSHNRYVALNAYVYGNERLETLEGGQTYTQIRDGVDSYAESANVFEQQGADMYTRETPYTEDRSASIYEEDLVNIFPSTSTSHVSEVYDNRTVSTVYEDGGQSNSTAELYADKEAAVQARTAVYEGEYNVYEGERGTIYSEGEDVLNQVTNAYYDNKRTTVGSAVGTDEDLRSTTDSAVATAADDAATSYTVASATDTALNAAEEATSTEEESAYSPGQNDLGPDGQPLSDSEQREVDDLEETEDEVVAHEQAHKTAGGELTGAISYGYTTGPDGDRYITEGEVDIDTSEEDTPEETIDKMERVKAAALAPAEPSTQDRRVASEATQIANAARREQATAEDEEEDTGTTANGNNTVSDVVSAATDSFFESTTSQASEKQSLGG